MKILITGTTPNSGMAIINALNKEKNIFIGIYEKKLPFNIHSKYIKPYYISSFSDKKFYEEILFIINKEKPDIVIPVGGAKYISKLKNEIKKFTNLLIPDYENFISAYDKKRMHQICTEVGINVPRRFTYIEAKNLLSPEKSFPLVIKPDYDAGGARGLKYIRTADELEKVKSDLSKNFGNYIIEEFIPGSSKMRTVQLVFNKQNKLLAYFILRKVHQWPITGGVTAYAISSNERELLEFVLPFFEKCQWEGPVEVELIIDARDNKPKLIEINPRFAGSVLFPIKCGVNFPQIICESAVNEKDPISLPGYNAGLFYISFSYYIKAILKEFNFEENKIKFVHQIFNELRRKKVSLFSDNKEIPMIIAKIWKEII